MRRRHPIPRLWLMTDERMGAGLWAALARLPQGSGVVFRHHATPPAARAALFSKVVRIARARRLVVLRGGADRFPGEAGTHNARPGSTLLHSRSVHDRTQVRAARRARADLVFVSPVFVTRSHPEARALGPRQAARLARLAGCPAIALGGMDAQRFRGLHGFHGWAAIDAWLTNR